MRHLLSAVPALALAACSLAPAYVRSPPPIPSSWPVGDAYLRQSEAALPVVSYADVFRDPRLQTLMQQALINNRDLRVALTNVEAARAQVRVVRSAQFPEVGLNGSADYSRSNGTGDDHYALRGGVSAFELDLFGRLANATAAERERALATETGARTVRLALLADLAQAWADLAADQDLLQIARETAANARRSVELTRARLRGGVAPRTDLSQAQQILAIAEGDVALRTTTAAQDVNFIRLLLGAEVDPALLPRTMNEVTASIATLPAGTNSEVLLRRPDVVEAEYRLRAAHADIGVARAELFPRISLTGLLGLASDALSSLLTGGAFTMSAGADASYSIFDAGGRRANVRVNEAQQRAALASYQGTIQTAFREIADALAAQGKIDERVRAAAANTAAAADVARLAEARYRGGLESFLASLDAQRSLYNARQAEIGVRRALVENRIRMFRVLGGDEPSRAAGAGQVGRGSPTE